jgi:hypothetical protein
MHNNTSQEQYPVSARAHEPWGPLAGLSPVQEYGVLAHELQECFPGTPPQHLDRMIAREMALYGGYSPEVIIQTMLEASPYLADGHIGDARNYVERTVDEAMQPESTADTVLGWGV